MVTCGEMLMCSIGPGGRPAIQTNEREFKIVCMISQNQNNMEIE